MLDTKTPNSLLFRLGRKPDPWSPPDWSRALPNGTFGNRFDDPQGNYRVLYAATQRVSCFIETLARFRPDLSLIAELQEIAGEDDYVPLGRATRTAALVVEGLRTSRSRILCRCDSRVCSAAAFRCAWCKPGEFSCIRSSI